MPNDLESELRRVIGYRAPAPAPGTRENSFLLYATPTVPTGLVLEDAPGGVDKDDQLIGHVTRARPLVCRACAAVPAVRWRRHALCA